MWMGHPAFSNQNITRISDLRILRIIISIQLFFEKLSMAKLLSKWQVLSVSDDFSPNRSIFFFFFFFLELF
jgi:hypothetical protein